VRLRTDPPDLTTRVRAARQAHGLSQEELAKRIGVTRQAIIAIENGRYVPNTLVALRLAHVLECRVDELFSLQDAEASVRLWDPSPPRSRRLVMAKVRGQLIGHSPAVSRPFFEGFPSADGLWVEEKSQAQLLVPLEQIENTGLIMGCDPSLSILSAHLARHGSHLRLACISACSLTALEAVSRGGVHIAGSHLRDAGLGDCNLAQAKKALSTFGGLVVTLASWEQGFVVLRGNPRKIRSVEDLTRKNIRFVNREIGAGTRQALDSLLKTAGISGKQVAGYDRIVQGHFVTAMAVTSGAADVGISLRAVAHAFDLDFVPLTDVRFDLVVPQDHISHPVVAALLDMLQSRQLKADLSALPGYDVSQTGRVQTRFSGSQD